MADAVSVLESAERISAMKLSQVSTGIPSQDTAIKNLVQCSYVDSAYLVDKYGNALSALDPTLDPNIAGSGGIFSAIDLQDSDFLATASVMKMVVNGYAGAGTIEMGGYDYHDGTRATGETRDFMAGQCIGACLEYAARVGVPLMIYVFSDGSLVSNGMPDNSVNGRGKGGLGFGQHQHRRLADAGIRSLSPVRRHMMTKQIGYYNSDGSVNADRQLRRLRTPRQPARGDSWFSTTWRCTGRRAHFKRRPGPAACPAGLGRPPAMTF